MPGQLVLRDLQVKRGLWVLKALLAKPDPPVLRVPSVKPVPLDLRGLPVAC